jgi:hypothetical protein
MNNTLNTNLLPFESFFKAHRFVGDGPTARLIIGKFSCVIVGPSGPVIMEYDGLGSFRTPVWKNL